MAKEKIAMQEWDAWPALGRKATEFYMQYYIEKISSLQKENTQLRHRVVQLEEKTK